VKIIIQRVSRAEVRIDGKCVARIGRGLLLLIGFEVGDSMEILTPAIRRIGTIRIFEDSDRRMNRGLDEIGGEVLAVSQFTLAAGIRKGRRPSFDRAMRPEEARQFFDAFVDGLHRAGIPTRTGVFGAEMEVELVNSGPVTLIWDSRS